MFLRLLCLGVLIYSSRVSTSVVIVGGQIKPLIRRQTIYLLCQMIFALACDFSNLVTA
jgi:hypothetical protein